MSSLLNPATAKSKRPSVCRTRLWPLGLPYIAGRPTSLAAYCRWYEPMITVDVSESFRLTTDDELPGWSGASSDSGINLQVKVRILEAENRYDLHLILRDGLDEITDDSWHDVLIPKPPPFDSGELEHGWPLGGVTAIHVLD